MTKGYNWDAIKSRIDLHRLIGASVALKRKGNISEGCCPFHDEKTPSFKVYDDHYHCFGCSAHGDAVDFVMAMKPGITHAEAVDMLGAGDIEPLTAPEKKRMAERRAEEESATADAIEKARLRWERSQPLPESGHPYLTRKGITPRHGEVRIEGINLLVPVYDASGEIVSVQSIPPADGKKLFQSGAPVGDGRLNIGIAIGRVICCEGYATGCSVFDAVPDQVRVSFSKDGVKKRISELVEQGIPCAIAADRKGLDDIIAFAAPLNVPVYVPPEPHDDFNDLAQAEGREVVAMVLRGSPLLAPAATTPATPSPEAANDDSDPVDVWSRNAPPDLPRDLLPPLIERFARIRSQLFGGDPGALAMSALAVCGAAIPDSVEVKVKMHEDWTEQARLWVMLIGDPSSMKSPIMRAAARKLAKMDTDALRDYERALAQWQAERKDGGPETAKPLETRLRMEDITMESAQEICRNSPEGVLALQDELSGWFGGIEKYAGGKGSAKDRSFWLRAYNGGEYAVSRVGRGSYIIDNLSVSILGGIQPDAIRRIMADATDDGLIQRFLPVIVPSAGEEQDAALPDVAREYDELVVRLRQIVPPGNVFGPLPINFSEGARRIREELASDHRRMILALETISKKFAAHIGKFNGIFPRMCLIWHCIENANAATLPSVINEETAQRVADFLHGYILGQSKAFYHGIINISEDQDQIEDVAGYILAHRVESVTPRTFSRGSTRMRKLTREHMEPIVQQLEALGWLEDVNMRGDKFSAKVNPRVHEIFGAKADAELEWRTAKKAEIQKMIGGG